MKKRKLPTKPQPALVDPLLASVIDSEAAAAICQLTQGAIKQAIERGELAAKKCGNSWVFHRATIEKFANTPRKSGPKPKNGK